MVLYDDGDREWVDLANEDFRLLKKKTKKRDSLSSTGSESELAVTDRARRKKLKRSVDGDDAPEISISERTDKHSISDICPREDDSKEPTSIFYRPASSVLPSTSIWSEGSLKAPQLTVSKSTSWVEESVRRSDSDSETDEDEVRDWAAKMFGIPLQPIATPKDTTSLPIAPPCGLEDFHHYDSSVQIPISEKVKRRRQKSVDDPATVCVVKKVSAKEKKALAAQEENDTDRRRREANRPLTRDEIQAILRIEDNAAADSSNYVRRSMRQPNRAALHTHGVRSLVDKLRNNDTDMIVLKMKKYINDPDTPPMVIDAILDALEENANCEALYIQVCSDRVAYLLITIIKL